MVTYILIAIVLVVLVFVAVVATRPTDFRITRSATLPAPPSVVFAHVNDFHKWEAWSPWAKMDPNAQNSYIGAPFGEGAMFSWDGNNKVGAGRMTMLESRPDERLEIKLEFFKPFVATNTTEFLFTPAGDGTTVTWTMTGKNNFMAKAFTLVMNCDKMVGGQFEEGLKNLKDVTSGETVNR